MVACERSLLGLALACIGSLGSIISCALPTWRISTFFLKNNIGGFIEEGLWKLCSVAPTGQKVCRGEGYILLAEDMKAARVFVIIAIIIEVLGILLGVAGRHFMNFVPGERQRSKMALTSGIAFLIAGIVFLIPLSWITNNISDNFHPADSPRPPNDGRLVMDLGAALYIGWFTTVLLFLGGGLVCSSFSPRNGTE